MTRSPIYALIGFLVLVDAGTAAATIMTIDPSSFASGQYVSYAMPGVTLSTMTLVPVGPDASNPSLVAYGPVLAPVYAFGDTFSASPSGGNALYDGGEWGTNSSNGLLTPQSCDHGCDGTSSTSVQWLRVDFAAPVNYVDVLQLQNQANAAEVAAFDSAGALVGDCLGYAFGATQGDFPCMSIDPSQYASGGELFQRPWANYSIAAGSDDISTLIIGGADFVDRSEIGTIEYGTVPEPATLGLLGLGLLALAWSRRRRLQGISATSPQL